MSGQKEDVLAQPTPDPTTLLVQRLDNWKHATGLLQDYLDTQLTLQKNITNSLEKTKKSLSDTPRFDFSSGDENAAVVGIAESFQTLRTRNDQLLNKSSEVEQSLKGSVGPQLETLKTEIEKHYKGLKGSNVKGLKDVDEAKKYTQKCIEKLGSYTSSFGTGAKVEAKNDPYVLHRLCRNAAADQLYKENNQTDAVLSSQESFQSLENHIVNVFQQANISISQIQSDWARNFEEAHAAVSKTFSAIPPDHEWQLFVKHNEGAILASDVRKRDLKAVTFSNDDHSAAQPVQEGIMQRKGKLSKSYNSHYYVLTQSNWLHAFKSEDFVQDPVPEWSMYLPESQLGKAEQQKMKFTLQGKSKTQGPSLGQKHTYQFKCSAFDDFNRWYDTLKQACGANYLANVDAASPPSSRPGSAAIADDSDVSSPMSPTSPVSRSNSRVASGANPPAVGGEGPTSPTPAAAAATQAHAEAATANETTAPAATTSVEQSGTVSSMGTDGGVQPTGEFK